MIPPPPATDRIADRLASGRTAAALKAEFGSRIEARVDGLLATLVRSYHDDTLTEPRMRGAIAGIAELRLLLSNLDREIQRAEQAGQALHREMTNGRNDQPTA